MSTIAAIATAPGTGGISVIRISGEKAFEVAEKVFKPANKKSVFEMKGYTACYGGIYSPKEGQKLDDGVLLIFRAPHSYTGEDTAEITCHGGVLITRRVLRACLEAGAVMAQAGEFTRRALLSGKMTLTQAEAVADMINSKSDQFLKCAAAQMDGALYKRIEAIKHIIMDLAVQISAWIDYPDEGLDSFEINSHIGQLTDCRLKLMLLLESYDVGQALRDGISVAIVGKPNVGKSTLMNLLVGCERSIVTDIEGTTRDIVEENVILGGTLFKLADCAGIRDTDNPVERIGVVKMERRLEQSPIVFAVFDYSRPLENDDYKLIEKLKGKNVLCIINKTDLPNKLDMAYLASKFGRVIEISANNPASLKKLNEVAAKLVNPEKLDISAGFIANERQREAALRAEEAIGKAIDGIKEGVTLDATGVMLETALSALAELTGESVSESIIDEVFKRFCVGK